MREIKFRAWDKDSKRMHYAEDLIGPGGWVIQFHGVPLEIGMVPSAQRLAHLDMRSSGANHAHRESVPIAAEPVRA